MAVIDCESFESTLRSISLAYSTSPDVVVTFLSTLNLEEKYAESSTGSIRDPIIDFFESGFGSPGRTFNRACWFHLTRVPEGTDFSDGILPMNLALGKIWEMVIAIPRDQETRSNLKELRRAVPDDLYNMKTANTIHFGPHAWLVKEAAFSASVIGNHDYLASPEIVAHICRGYQQRFGRDIYLEIVGALKACSVKFEVPEQHSDSVLAPALHYCWCKVRRRGLHYRANTVYDGEGVAIPHSAIRQVEFLDWPANG